VSVPLPLRLADVWRRGFLQHVHLSIAGRPRELNIPDNAACEIVKEPGLRFVDSLDGAVARALARPIGSPRVGDLVRPGDRIALILTDITRKLHEDRIIPALLAEIGGAGVPLSAVTGVVATGTHRPNSKDEMVTMYGAEVVRRIRIVNHDAYDGANLVFGGLSPRGIPIWLNRLVVEADVRIATGCIEPHLMAGYSGGIKGMSVGVAGEKTIAATHCVDMVEHPSTRLGVIEGNCFREFLNDVGNTVPLHFVVNVVQDGEGNVVRVVAGHSRAAFEEGVRAARRVCEAAVEDAADIVVTVPLSPKDCDLYQSLRTLNNIIFGPEPVVRPGGVILIPAACPDGTGHADFFKCMSSLPSPEAIIDHIRKKRAISPGEVVSLKCAKTLLRARIVITDTGLDPSLVQSMHFEHAPTLESAFAREFERYSRDRRPGSAVRVMVLPHGITTLPVIAHRRSRQG